MKKQSGFTLIELLIVVIIIAVLAALILPRFLSQPEKAVVAEANQILGAITRAQNSYVDSGAGTQWIAVSGTNVGWDKLGILAPSAAKYTYACTAGGPCTATRKAGSGDYAGAEISIADTDPAPTWTCNGGTSTKSYAVLSTGGCTV